MRKHIRMPFGTAALAALLLAAGCHRVDQAADAGDPADANLAPAGGAANDSVAGAGSAQQPTAYPAGVDSSRSAPAHTAAPGYTAGAMPPPPPEDTAYGVQPQQEAPGSAGYADEYAAPPPDANGNLYDAGAGYEQAAYTEQPPPPLPEYQQPPCPGENYLWTPGYWNYAQTGYFWVPGVWVVAPFIGALWTPGYWGFGGTGYFFHHGYWGPHIGFYGGINYGYGFFGHGYEGGYWNHNNFFYNRSVTVIHNNIRNVYVHTVSYGNFGNRVDYNGGRGGIEARPAAYEQAAAREQHFGALPAQQQHVEEARLNRAQFSGTNGARPQQLADARPLAGRTAATAQSAGLRPVDTRGGFQRPGVVNGTANTNAARAQTEQGRAEANQREAAAEQGRAQQLQGRALDNPRNGAANQARAQEQQQRAVESQSRAVNSQTRAQTFAQQSGNRQVEANQRQALAQQQHAEDQQRQAQQQQQRAAQQSQQQVQQQAREQQQRAEGEQQRATEQQQRVQPQLQQDQRSQPQQHSEPAPHADAPHADAPHAEGGGGGGRGPR